MRIVAGRHRGRRLTAPAGLTVRPTADRTREALFNILAGGKLSIGKADSGAAKTAGANPLSGLRVLDAFAGTGALGLEALSRGADYVVFMESQAAALSACRANIADLDEEERSEVINSDVLRPLPTAKPCSLILMDPPYNQDMATPALLALDKAGWLAPGALVVVELMKTEAFEPPAGFDIVDQRVYGKARLVFLRKARQG